MQPHTHPRPATPDRLPYGIQDLNHAAVRRIPRAGPIRCFIKGCGYLLRPPTRDRGTGYLCPVHEVFCHRSGTYRYADPRRNLLVDVDFFANNIIGHAAKFETHRFGNENSEDAVTWAVFRSFQKAGLLHELVRLATGQRVTREPQLFLWGIRVEESHVAESMCPLLLLAQAKMEAKLPVARPKTEPDIMLFQPGKYLVLIEAKLTSPNPVYVKGPRKSPRDLTLGELLSIYHDPTLQVLDYQAACTKDRIAYQLWRNTIFAEQMARLDGPNTKAFHANLVREGFEEATAAEFHTLFTPQFKDRFRRIMWEQIYGIALKHGPKLSRLCLYLESKTAGLTQAFAIPSRANVNAHLCMAPGRETIAPE